MFSTRLARLTHLVETKSAAALSIVLMLPLAMYANDYEVIFKASGIQWSIISRGPAITFGRHDGNGYLSGGNLLGREKAGFIADRGMICLGSWLGGRMGGLGACRNPDGSIFIGNYRDSKRSGEGTLFDKSGKVIQEGNWRDGKLFDDGPLNRAWTFDIFKEVTNQMQSSCFLGDCYENYGVKVVGGEIFAGLWREGRLTTRDAKANQGATLWTDNTKKPVCYYVPEFCTDFGVSLLPDSMGEPDCFNSPEACSTQKLPPNGYCQRGDCFFGYGVLNLEEGGQYWGFFDEGFYNGAGKLVQDGKIYIGEFKNGEKHGEGEYEVESTGVKLVGTWIRDKKDGFFKSFRHGELTSESIFVDDKRNGFGFLKYPSGDVYEGEWKDGRKHGQGTQTYSDGSRFEGTWDKGYKLAGIEYNAKGEVSRQGNWSKPKLEKGKLRQTFTKARGCISGDCDNGYGTLVVGDTRFTGYFENGQRHGSGRYITKEWTYEGDFKEDLMHGAGKFIYKDGSELAAEYRGGKPNGYGELTEASGAYYKGQWKNGQRNGYGVYVDAKSNKYDGNWLDNKKSGYGVQENSDGTVYMGEFRDGLFNGFGELVRENGQKYTGNFKDNLAHGDGAEYFSDGELIRKGRYEKGLIVERD
jgi:hypothetical protein